MTQQAAELVARARQGDEEAWELLFRKYEGLLRWIGGTFRLNHEQVADAAQTTWMQLVREIGKVREPEKLGAWLSVTMRRQCIRLASRQGREELRDTWAADELGVDGGVDTQVLLAERYESLWRAVDRLPDRQRELILALSATPSPSYKEVARSLGMPIGSIGPVRARALRTLRQLLTESDKVGAAVGLASAEPSTQADASAVVDVRQLLDLTGAAH
jgi:RNA polymerase sigma factor (sigma-70 family)